MKTQLLIKFTNTENLFTDIEEILTYQKLGNGWIFVLQNMEKPSELFITYNVLATETKSALRMPQTIVGHRKTETNTIYTINSINQLYKTLTGNSDMDSKWEFPFQSYKNKIILVRENGLEIIPTVVYNRMKVEEH